MAVAAAWSRAYLIWAGARTFARPAAPVLSPVPGAHVESPPAHRSTFARGIGVSGLNPKSLLLFVSLMPQFADPGRAWPVAGQLGVLGLTYVATCLVVSLALGTLAARWLTTRPRLARAVSRTSGAIMTIVGVLLIAKRLLF